MLRGPCFLVAIAMSAVSAAPVGFATLAITQPSSAQRLAAEIHASSPGSVIYFGTMGWMAITLVAILPIAFGTAAMAGLGAKFAWARSWLAWGIAGALPCLAIVLFAWFFPLPPGSVLTLAMFGSACALVSRAFIRWVGPVPQA